MATEPRPLSQAQVEMMGVVGIATAHSRAMGRPDPSDDELMRLLRVSDFAEADILRDFALVKGAAADSLTEATT